jgi:hypothetical protein
MLAYADACLCREVPPLAGSKRTGFANGKPLNSGATGQWVHTDSTTKSATGTRASEAPPIPPPTQGEKAREEQETGRQTAAMVTAAALNPPHLSTR